MNHINNLPELQRRPQKLNRLPLLVVHIEEFAQNPAHQQRKSHLQSGNKLLKIIYAVIYMQNSLEK